MSSAKVLLIAISVLVVFGILWAAFVLDRRSQRIQSAAWMRNWIIRNRVLADLYERWRGPLRLQDHSAATTPKTRRRKVAIRPRKRSTKG